MYFFGQKEFFLLLAEQCHMSYGKYLVHGISVLCNAKKVRR